MIVTQLSRYAPGWLQQLPSMAADGQPPLGATPGATRERMLRELADVVDAIAAARPVVLLLEDHHWSDPSTVERIDGMKAAGLPLDVVAYSAPHGLHAVSAAGGRGQPGTILASTSTRGKARSVSWPTTAN
jgi:hypothetical protein